MHSSVQTGLFSQSLLNNNEQSYHNYSSGGGGGNRYGHSPKHHVPLYNKACNNTKPDHLHRGKAHFHGTPASVIHSRNSSLTAINQIDSGSGGEHQANTGGGESSFQRSRLNLSSSNIAKLPAFVFLSNSNLDKISNRNLDQLASQQQQHHMQQLLGGKKASDEGGGGGTGNISSSSSSSIIGKIVSTQNLSRNVSATNLHNAAAATYGELARNGSKQQSNTNLNSIGGGSLARSPQPPLKEQITEFLDCTKPCGLLTTCLGVVMLLTSVVGFLFLFEDTLCARFATCSHPLLKLYAISALVIGCVLIFIGIVIVVYNKKDVKVIVTSAKNFDKIVHYKEKQQQHHQKHHHQTTTSNRSPQHQQSTDSSTLNAAASTGNKKRLLGASSEQLNAVVVIANNNNNNSNGNKKEEETVESKLPLLHDQLTV
jgi:hypothetical protein